MVKAVVVWAAVWVVCGWEGVSAQANDGFWWLSTTTPAPTTPTTTTPEPVYCECVAYYLCINGTINTSGFGLLDVRMGGGERKRVTNVERCPDVIDICCGIPTQPPPTTTPSKPTLPPDTPCECVSFINCTEDKLVSDGQGNTTLDFLGIGGYSHSKCPQALAVCCAVGPTTTSPPTTPVAPENLADCECVEPHLCKEDGYINTDGTGIINIRTRTRVKPNPQGDCPNGLVCCRLPLDNSTTATTTTTTTTTTTPPPVTDQQYSCGTRNFFGIKARILGFREGESQFGEFPWVTAILREETMMGVNIKRFVGGGTLIHPRVVITAAHKVLGHNASILVVRAGEWDTQQELEPFPFQDIQVQEILIHPRFNSDLLWHDVALLILQDDARVHLPHINTICMAEDLQNIDMTACVINGWGLNGFEEGAEYQKVMKSLTLPLVRRRQCVNSLRTTRLGRHFRLHNSFVCAGGEKGKDACKGDGGGPLACPRQDDPKRYLLVGITAWGIGCGEDGIPGVYVNVPAHQQWISSQIEARIPTTTTPSPTNATIYNEQLQDDPGPANNYTGRECKFDILSHIVASRTNKSGGEINGEITVIQGPRDTKQEERREREETGEKGGATERQTAGEGGKKATESGEEGPEAGGEEEGETDEEAEQTRGRNGGVRGGREGGGERGGHKKIRGGR